PGRPAGRGPEVPEAGTEGPDPGVVEPEGPPARAGGPAVTGTLRTQLTGLARAIALLKERVRAAVAGEIGRAVSGAVRQVAQAALAGQAAPPAYHRPASASACWDDEDEEDRWGRPRDPWADAPDPDDDDDDRDHRRAAPGRP